jgi:hypothetical protein
MYGSLQTLNLIMISTTAQAIEAQIIKKSQRHTTVHLEETYTQKTLLQNLAPVHVFN